MRDVGLLESALAMPEAGFGDRYLHADLFEMAAAYLFHIVKNHAFVDGNKRVGTHAAILFLDVNGYELEVEDARLAEFVISVVEGKTDKGAITSFLRKRARKRRT